MAESPALTATATATRPRLDSVDLLRGIVMVIMALDHARDFFGNIGVSPTNLTRTNAALFFTRWITHFCAPVFLFLAGTGAWLSIARGKSRGAVARFLVTRGLWLVFLEFTVIQFAWTFGLDGGYLFMQVIWVLGVSMIVLAGLIYLPVGAIAAVGAMMIAGHNLLDGLSPDALGAWWTVWALLHVPDFVQLPGGMMASVLYPLIPWIGVMAVGYAFGLVLQWPADARRRLLLRLGGALTLAFILLRAWNVYGDPSPWSPQATPLFTVLSFLKTTKYPPSLLFLLMTLGPAMLALAALERWSGPVARFFLVFGRVPLFYYILHLYLLHALAIAADRAFPPGSFDGIGLAAVYVLWIVGVAMLYPVCRWFAGVKARRREVWLSYL